jgi:hypothetical protein
VIVNKLKQDPYLGKPSTTMYKDLKEYYGQPVIGCEALQLNIKLVLDKREVWRKVIVPGNIISMNFIV